MPATDLEARMRGVAMNLARFVPAELVSRFAMGPLRAISRSIELPPYVPVVRREPTLAA